MVRAGHPARPSASNAHVRFWTRRVFPDTTPPRAPSPPPSQLFDSVSKNDLITYLACTGSVTREERSAGTFKCTDWETGRELHRKYKTRYVYLRERDVEGEEGVACAVTYLPQFGPVAGYREGTTFEYIDERGDKQKRNVIVRMRKETLRWGEPAEWRWGWNRGPRVVVRATPSRTPSTQRARVSIIQCSFRISRSRLVARPSARSPTLEPRPPAPL